MRNVYVLAAVVVIASLVVVPFGATALPDAAAGGATHFIAVLRGENEVPNPVETDAIGFLHFTWIPMEGTFNFHLVVCDIVDVVGAHVHSGAAGANGPIRVLLFPDAAPFVDDADAVTVGPGCVQLNEGTRTVDDLQGIELEDFLEQLFAGATYANVHTIVNRGGEIRGQLVPITVGTPADGSAVSAAGLAPVAAPQEALERAQVPHPVAA